MSPATSTPDAPAAPAIQGLHDGPELAPVFAPPRPDSEAVDSSTPAETTYAETTPPQGFVAPIYEV